MTKVKIAYSLCFVLLVLGVFSCKQKAATVEQLNTVKGCVVDATMNNITLITPAGDTINISTMDADPTKVSGVMINDTVEVIVIKEKVGENEILKAQQLTITGHSPYFYIQGTWVEPNPIKPAEMQGVTLNEDGTAASVGMATLLFKKWELTGDKLLLTSQSIGNKQTFEGVDTLQVVKLNADSLVLSRSGEVVWRFAKQK